jgi:hypothetical protein
MTTTITFHVYEMRGGPLDGEYMIFTGATAPTIYKHPLRETGGVHWTHMPPVAAVPDCHEYRVTQPGGDITLGRELIDELGSQLRAFVIEKMKTQGAPGLMVYDG